MNSKTNLILTSRDGKTGPTLKPHFKLLKIHKTYLDMFITV